MMEEVLHDECTCHQIFEQIKDSVMDRHVVCMEYDRCIQNFG
jgi:hypothetical protein